MKHITLIILLVSLVTLFGCGGGGGSTTPTHSSLSGTASKGAALDVDTVVTLTDASGTSRTTKVGVNGIFSLSIDGLRTPYLLSAGGYYSCASAAGTVNINPLTHLALEIALGKSSVTASDVSSLSVSQFTSVVADIKTNIDSVYPLSVPDTQRDFLSGTLVINAGVDKLFDSITIPATDSLGNFSISKTGGPQLFSGTSFNGTVSITPNSAVLTDLYTVIFPASTQFTPAMVAGRTFDFSFSGNGKAGSTTFRTDNTVLSTIAGVTTSGTWAVDSEGKLIVTFKNITETNILTLSSVTPLELVSTGQWIRTNPESSDTGTMTFRVPSS